MKSYYRKTLEYTAGNTFNKILLLLLLPLFTRLLTPEEYAIYTNIMIFSSFVGLIFMLGLQQSLFSHFYEQKTSSHQFTTISTILITVIVTSIYFSWLIFSYRAELSSLVTTYSTFKTIFIYVSFILFFDTLYSIILRIINTMELSLNFALLSLVKNLSLLILIIFATIAGKFSLETVFLYMLISSGISFIIAGLNIIRIQINLKACIVERAVYFSFPRIINLLKFGIPMISGTISLLILRISDRYMLTYLSANGLYDVGIYAVGYRIGMIISFLTTIVSLVYMPYAVKIASKPSAPESYRKIFRSYAVYGGILGAIIILFSWEISLFLLDTAYYEAVRIVVFSVISNYLLGLFYIVNIAFYIRKNATHITLIVGFGALLNIALNFFLIPRLGVYGAGLTSMISYFLIFILNHRSAEKMYPVNYDLSYVVYGLMIMALISVPNFFLTLLPKLSIFKMAFLLIVVVYLYFKYLHKKPLNKIVTSFIEEEIKA